MAGYLDNRKGTAIASVPRDAGVDGVLPGMTNTDDVDWKRLLKSPLLGALWCASKQPMAASASEDSGATQRGLPGASRSCLICRWRLKINYMCPLELHSQVHQPHRAIQMTKVK